MTITVISALPKSAPVANADTSTNSTGSTNASAQPQDFLALLLGLGLQTGSTVPGSVLEQGDTQENTDVGASDAGIAAQDGLLAALGLVNGNIPATTLPDTDGPDKRDTATSGNTALMGGIGKEATRSETLTSAAPTSAESPLDKSNIMSSLRATPLATPDEAAKIADDTAATKETGTLPGTFAETLNRVSTTNTTPSDATRTAELSVRTPVKGNDWQQAFNDKIVWMASNEKQSARITLNPEQMGPIEVSLNLDNGSATATFVSANSEVRESIETALPKLREMFAGIGIELGQANVSNESFKQPTSNGEEYSNRSQERNGNGILATGTTTVSAAGASSGAYAKQQGIGLVDIFA